MILIHWGTGVTATLRDLRVFALGLTTEELPYFPNSPMNLLASKVSNEEKGPLQEDSGLKRL